MSVLEWHFIYRHQRAAPFIYHSQHNRENEYRLRAAKLMTEFDVSNQIRYSIHTDREDIWRLLVIVINSDIINIINGSLSNPSTDLSSISTNTNKFLKSGVEHYFLFKLCLQPWNRVHPSEELCMIQCWLENSESTILTY